MVGELIIGEVDKARYSGEMVWSPVTSDNAWQVTMDSISIGKVSLCLGMMFGSRCFVYIVWCTKYLVDHQGYATLIVKFNLQGLADCRLLGEEPCSEHHLSFRSRWRYRLPLARPCQCHVKLNLCFLSKLFSI